VIPMVKMGLIRQSKKVEKIARCAN
jgi:hypothetical protein